MKAIGAAILLVVFLSASLTGWQLYAQPDNVVIGGEYVVATGQTVPGDLSVWFAQIRLEDGASVQGSIRAVSSVLDLGGRVEGSILGVGSDVIVRATAQLSEEPRSVQTISYVILLPRMARSGQAASAAQ